MSDNATVPTPPIPLEKHCSAIWNNTLYVYSPRGFQSLALEPGAEWEKLEPGQSVTGAQCVPAGNDAFYIVGGTPPDALAALSNYSGLQRYQFSSKKWEVIKPTVPVTQNRVNHGASFITTLNSILVYSGTQDPSGAGTSTQTFLISAAPPYGVLSFNSQGAPALSTPMVMPWSADQAVVLGGSADNTQVWLFGQPQGFTQLGTSLPPGLGLNTPTRHCTIVTGDDGSKVLEIYDLGATPNTVTRYALWVNGAPAPVGQQVGVGSSGKSTSSRRRRIPLAKRDLTVADWPAYNSTLAPTTSRTGFSLAESEKGLAVISGGSSADPIAVFNQETNAWMDPNSFFVDRQQSVLTSPASSSLPPVSTVSPTASSTSTASPSSNTDNGMLGTGQSRTRVLTTLGATLGAIFGLAALLLIALLILRWRKLKKRRAAARMTEKEDRLSFADQGADFMSEAEGPRGYSPTKSKSAHSSITSLAIFNAGNQNSKSVGHHRRGMASDSSMAPIAKNKSPLGVSEPMEMAKISHGSSPTFTNRSAELEKDNYSPPKMAHLAPVAAAHIVDAKSGMDERSRSNGWSRYFANNEVENLASMPREKRDTYESQASEASRSDYDDERKSTGQNAVQPLELNLGPKFEGQRFSNVPKGSPKIGHSDNEVRAAQSAELGRAASATSRFSDYDLEASRTSMATPASYTAFTTQTTYDPRISSMSGSFTAFTTHTTYEGSPAVAVPFNKSFDKSRKDIRSVSSSYSGNENPFFGSSASSDLRSKKGPTGVPMPPKLNLQNYGHVSRGSNSSAVTVFPGAGSPRGSPKAGPNDLAFPSSSTLEQLDAHTSYGFPKPGTYFVGQRDSNASAVTIFPGAPPAAQGRSRNSNFAAGGPFVRAEDGATPRARKENASEDLGWLKLDAGKAV